jgi:putative acetyltransferase
MVFRIRPMRKSDSYKVVRLHRQTLLKINNRDYTAEQMAVMAGRLRGRLAWQAVEKGIERKFVAVNPETKEILGFCGYHPEDGELSGLYVSHQHQGEGIGRMLVEFVLKKVQDLGFEEVPLIASVTAAPFYQKLGFEVLEHEVRPVKYREQTIQLECVKMVKKFA